MPVGIDPSDRKLLLIAGTALIVLMAGLVFLSPAEEDAGESAPSSYSGAPGGARGAFLLLKELHYDVEHWENPPADLPADPDNETYILADPLAAPSKQEKEALHRFVEHGGRVLFTGSLVGLFFPEARILPLPFALDWKKVEAKFPSAVSREAEHISLRPQAKWSSPDPLVLPLYGDSDSTFVVRWKIGKGEVFWWAAPSPLTNAGLLREGNLNFFLNSVDPPAPDEDAERPHIYWDEYFHGQRSSLWEYIGKTPIPWGLVQIAALGLAVLFAFSRRSGPIFRPARVSRLSPLEFVNTLGGLYERAGAAPTAVGVALQRFRSSLTRQLRLPPTVSDATLEEASRQRLDWKEAGLSATLQRAAAASKATKLDGREALEIVRALEQLEERMRLKKRMPQEKT